MKLIYSQLQKFLPDLSVKPEQLRDDLTMIGHFTNYFDIISPPLVKEGSGEIDYVFDLDIKVNRGDCLGYYGIARDLSVFYNLPLKNLSYAIKDPHSNYSLPIQINTSNVKRIMAAKICHIKNTSSPQWLQTFLKCHGLKSINTLVDLTNYIMLLYGIPNHAFDTFKSTDKLIWEMNSQFKEFTSLDGSKLTLNNNILIIDNSKKVLSLSFWGGESCAIGLDTTDTIIEVAVYDRTVVRQNSRQLKSVTEASIRLEKDLDPELIPIAFNHLINLVLTNCGGQVSSQIFDYYPNKLEIEPIEFDPQKPAIVSGIDISPDFAIDCLTRLGCVKSPLSKGDLEGFTPPSIRKDITIEADLIEEVVRFNGYQKIPKNQPLIFKDIVDITPPEIYLIENLKDKLVEMGYDEVLTWPLVTSPTDEKTVIKTQNSINSEAIYLRQSLIPSLEQQLDQYSRFKLPNPQFFEIGKVFNLKDGQYIEQNALCIYNSNLDNLRRDVLQNVSTDETNINFDGNFAEIIIDDLSKPDKYIPKQIKNTAVELTSQIITLDANITLNQKEDEKVLIKKYSDLIGTKYLWQLIITDIFPDPKTNKFRYTFKVSYFNTDDKTAKTLHLKTFDLV